MTLSDAQINLINKIGYSSITTDSLSSSEEWAAFEGLQKSRLIRVRKTSKFFNPEGIVFHELSKKGFALYETMKAPITAPIEDETLAAELPASVDEPTGPALTDEERAKIEGAHDENFDYLSMTPIETPFKRGDKALWRGCIPVEIVEQRDYLGDKRVVKMDVSYDMTREREFNWDVRVSELASVDPRDARIRELEARVKELEAEVKAHESTALPPDVVAAYQRAHIAGNGENTNLWREMAGQLFDTVGQYIDIEDLPSDDDELPFEEENQNYNADLGLGDR